MPMFVQNEPNFRRWLGMVASGQRRGDEESQLPFRGATTSVDPSAPLESCTKRKRTREAGEKDRDQDQDQDQGQDQGQDQHQDQDRIHPPDLPLLQVLRNSHVRRAGKMLTVLSAAGLSPE